MEAEQLSEEIWKLEARLAGVIERNNELEMAYLARQFQYMNKDRPNAVHKAFVHAEAALFGREKSTINQEILESEIDRYEKEIPALRAGVEDLNERVSELRRVLYQIIEQTKQSSQRSTIHQNIRRERGRDLEARLRDLAAEMGSVPEDVLVQYLARGRQVMAPEDFLEKAKELASVKFDRKVYDRMYDALKDIIPQVTEICQTMSCEETEAYDSQLVDLLNSYTRKFSEKDEGGARSMCEDMGFVLDESEDVWPVVDATLSEVKKLRETLLEVANTKLDEQVPTEPANCEKEKHAMGVCLEALRVSNDAMMQYIDQLATKYGGVIDTRVHSLEEIRQLKDHYNSLQAGK